MLKQEEQVLLLILELFQTRRGLANHPAVGLCEIPLNPHCYLRLLKRAQMVSLPTQRSLMKKYNEGLSWGQTLNAVGVPKNIYKRGLEQTKDVSWKW